MIISHQKFYPPILPIAQDEKITSAWLCPNHVGEQMQD